MFPLFHLAVPLGLSEIPYIKKNFRINRFSLLFGALSPDIFDKFLYFIGIGPGRFICHTLIFLISSTIMVFILSQLLRFKKSPNLNKSYNAIAISYFVGVSIHLLLDLPKVPLLYPFIPNIPITEGDKLIVWITKLITDPIVIITEISGLILILYVFFKNKLYHLKDMWYYLILTQ